MEQIVWDLLFTHNRYFGYDLPCFLCSSLSKQRPHRFRDAPEKAVTDKRITLEKGGSGGSEGQATVKETHSYVWDDGANVTPAEGPILLLMHRQVELHIHSQPRIRSEDPVRYSVDPDRTLKSMLRRFRGSKIEGGLNPKRSFWKSPKSLIDLRTLPLPSIQFSERSHC